MGGVKTAISLIASFVGITYGFGIYIFSQLLPDMSRDLGFDYGFAGFATGAGQFAFILFALAGTWLSNRYSGASVMLGSVLLCAVCLLMMSVVSSPVVMAVLLFLMAGTSASVYVPLVDVVSRLISTQRRGIALGLISSGTSYGVAVSAVVVWITLKRFGWELVWPICGVISILLLVWAFVLFRRLGLFDDTSSEPGEPSSKKEMSKGAKIGILQLILTWAGLIWLIKFVNGFSFMSYQNFLSPLLRDFEGNSAGYTSAVWAVLGVVGMASGLLVGAIGDRFGIKNTLMVCYGLFFVSSVIVAILPSGVFPFIAVALFSLAFYPIYGLVPAYVSKVASGAVATAIFGLANAAQGLGGIFGNVVGGQLSNSANGPSTLYLIIGCGAFALALATRLLPREDKEAPVPASHDHVSSRA